MLPAWEAGIAGSGIKYYSLPAWKSCHSSDDIMDRIYGLLCIYLLSLLSRASKTPVSHSICSALEQNFKIRPCVCKSSAM